MEHIAQLALKAAPVAQNAGVRLCLENHTEAFSDEVEKLKESLHTQDNEFQTSLLPEEKKS